MTAQEFQAGCIERAGQMLAFHLRATQPDKRDWKPPVEGATGIRSALDMVSECIFINRWLTHLLATGVLLPIPFGPDKPRAFQTGDEAGLLLEESARELARVVRGMSENDLAREYESWRGLVAGALLIEVPYRNMQYHCGQINLIQLLYGDAEFRPWPPRP